MEEKRSEEKIRGKKGINGKGKVEENDGKSKKDNLKNKERMS